MTFTGKFVLGFLSRTFSIQTTAGEREMGERGGGISLIIHYYYHPLHRHLDISRAITAESLPLHIPSNRTQTGSLFQNFRTPPCLRARYATGCYKFLSSTSIICTLFKFPFLLRKVSWTTKTFYLLLSFLKHKVFFLLGFSVKLFLSQVLS